MSDEAARLDSCEPEAPRGKHGGHRLGAGRPKGAKNALPQGAVAALRALKHRVPEGTPEELADLAGEALETVADVMRGRFRRGGTERLNAARAVREEVCGPVKQKLEHTGSIEITKIVREIVRPEKK